MIDNEAGAHYLFCYITWMKDYKGQTPEDRVNTRGGKHVKENEHGSEVCNFLPNRGKVYGYVRVPRGGQINIDKLDAKGRDSVSGVTVVWTAGREEDSPRRFVVGWYNDAIVYRKLQKLKNPSKEYQENKIEGYHFEAREDNAVLLPVDERIFPIPKRNKKNKIGMGQANIWYAEGPECKPLILNLEQFFDKRLQVKDRSLSDSENLPRGSDSKKNKLVETAAIKTTCMYYSLHGYSVKSVERDNVGWDLEATKDNKTLKIEVKGLSGAMLSVELTPNEYNDFSKRKEDYRLCVVYKALINPTLIISQYCKEKRKWTVKGNDSATIIPEERTGASIKFNLNGP